VQGFAIIQCTPFFYFPGILLLQYLIRYPEFLKKNPFTPQPVCDQPQKREHLCIKGVVHPVQVERVAVHTQKITVKGCISRPQLTVLLQVLCMKADGDRKTGNPFQFPHHSCQPIPGCLAIRGNNTI
jgi:hypothetical protein